MLTYLPRKISNTAILVYIISLTLICIIFSSHIMSPLYIALGITWVFAFFYFSTTFSQHWSSLDEIQYKRKLFITALVPRIIWVLFSFVYYTMKTGMPFEFGASDSWGYHDVSVWLSEMSWANSITYLREISLSDSGYPMYLFLLYKIIGPRILLVRIIKALLSSWMCLIIYNIAKRNFGESVGRMAGIFICLMPNLIIYCGLHLKETEMLFLATLCLDRFDILLHSKKINYTNLILGVLLLASLFAFRTILGATMAFAIFSGIVFSRSKTLTRTNRILLIIWAVAAVGVFAGGRITQEVQKVWNDRSANQNLKRTHQVNKGIEWAKYATGSVMAPMMFVLPFPTMVDVDNQYNQQIIHGGNYVKNFLGIFVIITTYSAIFVRKNWRDFSLIGTYLISYLGVVCSSGFANSERFLLPGVPMLMIMAAYGVSIVSPGNYRYVRYWYMIVAFMAFGWAFFKLGSRGII